MRSPGASFSSRKRERIRRRTYKTREEALQDVSNYVEMFYSLSRQHVRNGRLSPLEAEGEQAFEFQRHL